MRRIIAYSLRSVLTHFRDDDGGGGGGGQRMED